MNLRRVLPRRPRFSHPRVTTAVAPLLSPYHLDSNPRSISPTDRAQYDPLPCRSCGAPTWWGLHRNGQRECDAWEAPDPREAS